MIARDSYIRLLKEYMHDGQVKVITGDNHIIGLSREARRN